MYTCILCIFNCADINPLYSVKQLNVTPSSTTLQCQLACKTRGLQCRIVLLTTNFENVPLTAVHQTGLDKFKLQGLSSSTIYNYCISAFDTITNEFIGFQICGKLETGQKGNYTQCKISIINLKGYAVVFHQRYLSTTFFHVHVCCIFFSSVFFINVIGSLPHF